LKADSNFEDCARTTYEVASEMYGEASKEQEAVKSGWQKVGIQIKQAKKP
jgi:Zn-dependent metalloprotease